MKKILLITALSLCCLYSKAKITLPQIIGDNMVLQEGEANIWGWANAGSSISIKPSWSSQVVKAKTGKDGKWIVKLSTPKASYTEHSITISGDGSKISLKNVLVGQVWFTSGQSNMEMPLNGFWNCPVEGSNETIVTASKWKGVRMVTIPKTGSLNVEDKVDGAWQCSCPQTIRWWSATATYFAQMLNAALDVPVGIVNCSWGGSRVESWLPEELVRTYEDIDFEKQSSIKDENGFWRYDDVTIMYNAMYNPIRNYTVKGFLWYQGESNVGKEDTYGDRFKELVKIWREDQGCEAPVFWVELCPWIYGGDGTSGAKFREMQHRISKEIPNSAMVCTNDLVYPDEDTQIHPRNKRGVGERLAYCALNMAYGISTIEYRNPCYKNYKVESNVVEIFFDNAEDGLYPWANLEGFEIAGPDGIFHPATAWLFTDHKSIKVFSPNVYWPKAVRYCFKDFQLGNVKSAHNLPLVPFRVDLTQ